MRIGLIDVDGHNFPNLALMKISAYHKQQQDHVEKIIPMLSYDKVYMSKIFDESPDFDTCINAKEIELGGRAYDKKKVLPKEIENIYPDYSLYNIKNEAYGYLTRGCPRACPFCDVVNIEGKISHKVADLSQFWKGEKNIKLLDPNTLAAKEKIELLDQLITSKAWIDFTQGLDIRFMTEEIIEKIMQIKIKMIHFAWDTEKDSDLILKNLEKFKILSNLEMRKTRVYVLVNYNTDFEFDLYRVYKLKDLGYDPYVMIKDKHKFVNERGKIKPNTALLKQFSDEQIKHFKKVHKLQRKVDNKFIWFSGELETIEKMKKECIA